MTDDETSQWEFLNCKYTPSIYICKKQSLLCNLEQRVRVIWGVYRQRLSCGPHTLIPQACGGAWACGRWRTSSPDDLMLHSFEALRQEASFIGVSQDGNQSSPKQTRHKAGSLKTLRLHSAASRWAVWPLPASAVLWFLLVMGGFNLNQQIPETHTTAQETSPKTK